MVLKMTSAIMLMMVGMLFDDGLPSKSLRISCPALDATSASRGCNATHGNAWRGWAEKLLQGPFGKVVISSCGKRRFGMENQGGEGGHLAVCSARYFLIS